MFRRGQLLLSSVPPGSALYSGTTAEVQQHLSTVHKLMTEIACVVSILKVMFTARCMSSTTTLADHSFSNYHERLCSPTIVIMLRNITG